MGESTITVNVSCPHCGGVLETKDDVPTDASVVTCTSCGSEIGTYGEVVAEGARIAKEKAQEIAAAEFAKIKKQLSRAFKFRL
jgi:hypothetical protein